MQFNVLEDEEQSGTTSDLPVTSWEDCVCVCVLGGGGGWCHTSIWMTGVGTLEELYIHPPPLHIFSFFFLPAVSSLSIGWSATGHEALTSRHVTSRQDEAPRYDVNLREREGERQEGLPEIMANNWFVAAFIIITMMMMRRSGDRLEVRVHPHRY